MRPLHRRGRSPIPTTAALALALPGTASPATVTLTVQRDVPGLDYLWIPVITGLAMAGAFVILAGMIGVPYRNKRGERDTATLFAGKFWTTPVYATAAWTFSGSWATNITALGTAIATILTAKCDMRRHCRDIAPVLRCAQRHVLASAFQLQPRLTDHAE